MVIEFTLRARYDSISDIEAAEASLIQQFSSIYGIPEESVSVELQRASNGRTIAVFTVTLAAAADEPAAVSMAQALMDGTGLDEMGANEFECVANCGAFSQASSKDVADKSTFLSTTVLAGIASGAVLLLLVGGIGAYLFLKKRKEKMYLDNMSTDAQMTTVRHVQHTGGIMYA